MASVCMAEERLYLSKMSSVVRNSWDDSRGTMPLTSYDRLLRDLEEVSPMPMLSFWGSGEPLMHGK